MEPEKIVRLVGWGSILFGLLFVVPLYTSFFTEHYANCLDLANKGEHEKALECERALAAKFSRVPGDSRSIPSH